MADMRLENAMNVYRQAASRTVIPSEKDDTKGLEHGDTFSGVLKGVVDKAVTSSEHSEEMTLKAMNGQADLKDVVTAVSNAEMSLKAVVNVRDKVLSAYQQILKMQI